MSNRKDYYYSYHKKPSLSMDYSSTYNNKPENYISSYLVKKGPKIIEEPTKGYNFEEYFRVLPPHLYSRYYNSHKYLNQGKRYFPNLRLNIKRGLNKPSSTASSLVSTPSSVQCSRSPSPIPFSRPTSPLNEINNANNRCLSPRNFHTLSSKTTPDLIKPLNEKSRSLHSINCSKENSNLEKKENKKSHPLLLNENDETACLNPNNLLEALSKNIIELTDNLSKFLKSESLKKKYCDELDIIEKVNQLKDVSQMLQENKVVLDENLSNDHNRLQNDDFNLLKNANEINSKKPENAILKNDELNTNKLNEDNSINHKVNELEQDKLNKINICETDQKLEIEENNFKNEENEFKNTDNQKFSESSSQDEEFFECSTKNKKKLRKSVFKSSSNKLNLSQLIDKAIEEQVLGQWLKLSDSIDDENGPIQNKNLIEKLKNKFSTKLAIIHYKLYQKYTKNTPIKNVKKWRHQKLNKSNKIQSKYTFLQGLMDDDRFVQFLMDKISYFMSKIKTCKTQRKESKNLEKTLKEICVKEDNCFEKSLDSIDSKYSDENNNESLEVDGDDFSSNKINLKEDSLVNKENLKLLEKDSETINEELNELLNKEILIEKILEKENLELETLNKENLESESEEKNILEKEISEKENLEKENLEKENLENLKDLDEKNKCSITEEIIISKKNNNETGFIDYKNLNKFENLIEKKYSEKNNLITNEKPKKKSYVKIKIFLLIGSFVLIILLWKWFNETQKCTTCNQGLNENKLILRPVESKSISNFEISCNHWIIMEAQKLLVKKKSLILFFLYYLCNSLVLNIHFSKKKSSISKLQYNSSLN